MLGSESVAVSFGKTQSAVVVLKVAATLACFWYLFRHLDIGELRRTLPDFDFRWGAGAVFLLMLQIPLMAARWLGIIRALRLPAERLTFRWIVAASAVGQFFGQLLPVIAGDGVRVWLLGSVVEGWRGAAMSVVIDRCIGIALLFAISFIILLSPSGLGAFEVYRLSILAVLGSSLLIGLIAIGFGVQLGAVAAQYRGLQWLSAFFVASRRSVLGPHGAAILGAGCFIHLLSIAAIWMLGRAQGLNVSLADAALLFAVMVGIALFPLTVGGWGLRELAMVSLFGNYGLTPERALVFSMYFGVTCVIASLPGAVAWLAFLTPRSMRVASPRS